MAVLVGLLSVVTWVPGLILFLIQASLAGASWVWSNLWMAASNSCGFVQSISWFSALLAMALSAWIKRKVAAGAALLGVFFSAPAFGQAINAVLRTQHGSLIESRRIAYRQRRRSNSFISARLSGYACRRRMAGVAGGLRHFACYCSKKSRAYEVVQG